MRIAPAHLFADPNKAGTNPISNNHLVHGFSGLNSLFNDLTAVPAGTVLLHVSGMVLLLGAVSAWAVTAWRREAGHVHEAAGNRSLSRAGLGAAFLCALTIGFLLVPVSVIDLLNPIARALGLGDVN